MVRYLILLSFFMAIQTFGQIDVKGRVLDKDNNILVGAAVQIFNIDTSKLIDYTFTDFDGNWKIKNIKLKNFIVVAKYLGYTDTYITLNNIVSDYIIPTIILVPKDYQLKVVSIKAKRLDFVIRGDTISYNVEPLRDSTDFYLEDILQRIPELEIKEGKQIYFKGKKVDRVLVEGKDLYNNKHRFFLQSFAPKDINKIEIIQDYQDITDRFNKAQRKKTAINVKLKESSKGVIKIISETALGYKNKYEHNSNLYYIKNRFGFNSYFKANNRGESDLNIMDFLRLDITKVDKLGSNIDRLVPQGFKLPMDLNKNHDNVFAFNMEYKLDTQRITRFSVLGAHLTRYNKSEVYRTYLSNNTKINGEQIGKSIFRFIDESFSTKLLLQNNLFFGINTPLRYINSYGRSDLQDIEQIGIYSIFSKEYHDIDFSPSLFLTFNIIDEISLKLGDDLLYNSYRYINQYKDSSLDSIWGFDNNVRKHLVDNNVYLSLRYKDKNLNWNFQHSYKTVSNSFNSDSYPNFLFINMSSSMNDVIHKSKVHLYNKINKYVFSTSINFVERHKRVINDSWNILSYFDSKIYLGYEFSIMKGLGLSFNFNKSPFSFNEISNTPFLTDNRTISKGIIPFDELKKQKSVNIYYYNFESDSNNKIFSDFSYSDTEKPIVYNTLFEDGFIVIYKILGKRSKNYSGKFNVKRKFKKVLNRVDFKFDYNNNLVEKNDSKFIKFSNYIFKLNFDLKFSDKIEIKTGYNYSISKHILHNLITNYSSHKPFITLTYKNKRTNIKNEFIYETNFILKNKISYPQWNANVRYKINSRFAFYIKGKDLLNFQGKQYRSFIANEQFLDIRNYIKFPGYILFGVHYSN